MLAPAILHIVIFSHLPMAGVVLAFKDYNYTLGILGSPWTGLDNFRYFFISGSAWLVTRNTLLYNIAFIVLIPMFQIPIAVILSEIRSVFFKKFLLISG